MSRIAKIIILILLLLAISLPIVGSVNAGVIDCNQWTQTCLSGDPNPTPYKPHP
ncbi:MAG TPA: hypothetical protein PLZ51_20110 [Aggregatilineales bacterium]|nr:hypothetical protein [Aggregatilineales bacterium]